MLIWIVKKLVVWLLGFIDPFKPYGPALFDALSRLMPFVGLETVCLRRKDGRVEVFMTLRKADEVYAEEWHSPGSIYRMREEDGQVVLRLEQREFGARIKLGPLVGKVNNVREVRGHAICLVHVCEMAGESTSEGKWFPVDDLPKNTIAVHRDEIIPMAAKAFLDDNPEPSETLPNGLTLAEEDQLVALLGKLNPRRHGTKVFNAMAWVKPTLAMEFVCLRQLAGKPIEVYMTRRAKDDSAYPGMVHCPGTAPLTGEEESETFDRIAQREFGCKFKSVEFINRFNHTHEARGHFLSEIFLCEPLEGSGEGKGEWYPVDDLPADTVDHHRDPIIPIAVRAYQQAKVES